MTATDVSSKLGEYMLKGWVLTDNICPAAGCSVPLMRSPTGRVPVTSFCANCDADPRRQRPNPPTPLAISPTARAASPSDAHTSSSHLSRSSTPPTEVSSTLSSPTFAAPVDTPDALRRRQQSDAASAEIGKRLLKGWAMLADECPNPRCYGVPLVRPPQAGGGKDPRKECVACGTVYILGRDEHGWDRLVIVDPPELRDNRVFRESLHRDDPESPVLKTSALNEHKIENSWRAGADANEHPTLSRETDATAQSRLHQGLQQSHTSAAPERRGSKLSKIGTENVLDETTKSLELALQSLSQRLTTISGTVTISDPMSIGQTADAMGKVAQALTQIERLREERTRSAL